MKDTLEIVAEMAADIARLQGELATCRRLIDLDTEALGVLCTALFEIRNLSAQRSPAVCRPFYELATNALNATMTLKGTTLEAFKPKS